LYVLFKNLVDPVRRIGFRRRNPEIGNPSSRRSMHVVMSVA
jgi:hypothetical protein